MSTAQTRYCAACGREIGPNEDAVFFEIKLFTDSNVVATVWYHRRCLEALIASGRQS